MKYYRFTLLLLSIFIALLPAKSLIQIDNLGEEKYHVPVMEFVDNHFIVLADDAVIERITKKRLQYKVLDNDVSGKNYYLVHPFYNSPEETIDYSVNVLKKYGTVLASYTKLCLMESDDETLHSMKEYRVKLQHLDLEPIDFNNNTIHLPEYRETKYNPNLQKMLDMVSPDSVEAFQRKLCSFKTRHANSTCSKKEFIPWIEKFYLAHGCDTALKITISTGVYEIVGVRYGEKEQSLKNAIILGGHSDVTRGSAELEHQGANDNATGQVAVMEACRIHSHFKFDRTIFYATHNAEEIGLKGSRALAKWMKNTNVKTYGGIFTYDMFGMKKSNIRFEVYSAQSGAQEFCDKMSSMKSTYKLSQPGSIKTRSSKPGSSDFVSYINSGYLTMNHNFASSGAGKIHSAADVMKESYDKVFQAEVAKLGLITTAEFAGVQGETSLKSNTMKLQNSVFTITQHNRKVIFTLPKTSHIDEGNIEVFNVKGKLIRAFKTGNQVRHIVWDGTHTSGAKIANGSIVVIKYSNPTITTASKLVMK